MPAEKILIKLFFVFKKFDLVFNILYLVFKIIGKNYCEVDVSKIGKDSYKVLKYANLVRIIIKF